MRTLVLLFVAACTDNATGIVESDIACDSTLTYANFGQAFITTNCLDCHGGKESPNLSTQSSVQTNTTRILDEAVYSSTMPATGTLTNDERIMLGQWLECGAL
jgi:uncharacterized membrane protein